MLSVEEYRARVLALGAPLPTVARPLAACRGLRLAEPLRALVPVPPFDNSAMDGFAVRVGDVAAGGRLPVDGDTPAGATSVAALAPGQARRIMTGAPLPQGADAVVPVEETDIPVGPVPLPTSVEIRVAPGVDRHIRRAGGDVAVGDEVLPAGALLTPAALGSAASVGHGTLVVHRPPRVAVVTTGDELIPAGEALRFGQIPDSNSVVLAALLADAGAEVSTRRLGDDPETFAVRLAEAATGVDLVITTGGVSAGAYDVVKAAVPDAEFVHVALQPGKPQGCGSVATSAGPVPLVALPGNPVSVFVSYQLFVRPLLAVLAGGEWSPRRARIRVVEELRSPAGRRQYLPAVVTDAGAVPVRRGGFGSHMAASLARAEALLVVPEDVTAVAAGTELELWWL